MKLNKVITILLLIGVSFGTLEVAKLDKDNDFFSDRNNTQLVGEKTVNNVIKTFTALTDTLQTAYNTTTQLLEPVITTLAAMFNEVIFPMIQGTAALINWALTQISKLDNKIGDLDIIIPLPVIPIGPKPPIIKPPVIL